MLESVDQTFPFIARWVTEFGYVHIGFDDTPLNSFVRVLDEGGMMWEGAPSYPTLEDALRALDGAIRDWLRKQGFDK